MRTGWPTALQESQETLQVGIEIMQGATEGLCAANSEQVLPTDFAHLQAMPVGEENPAFVATFAQDLSHVVDVDDDGAMDADEFLRIERIGKLFNRFAQHEFFRSDMQAGVVVRRLDPINLGDL